MAIRTIVVVLVAGLTGFAPAPPPRADRLNSGVAVKNLQGNWTVIRYEHNKSTVGLAGLKVRINNERWDFLREKMPMPTASYHLVVDTAKNPAWLDLTRDDMKTFVLQGIAKMEDDTLTISFTTNNMAGKRPMEFTSEGAATYLLVLKRDKP